MGFDRQTGELSSAMSVELGTSIASRRGNYVAA